MAKLDGFILPKPDRQGNKYIWHPVPRMGRITPWGYEVDPDDDEVLIPIPEQLELLEEAKKLRKRYSYRQLAQWLSANTGRYISYAGLRKRFENDRRRKTKAQIQRDLAKKYEKAIKKAEELERQFGGEAARTPTTDSSSGSEA